MNIRKLHIKGYKSVADLSLEALPPLLVFAGANGAGKSNIVDALAFLGAVVKFGAVQARARFGGFELQLPDDIARYLPRVEQIEAELAEDDDA